MKKWHVIFLFIFVLFFISCENKEIINNDPDPIEEDPVNPIEEKEENEITLNTGSVAISLDSTLALDITKKGNPVYSYNYDEEIIRVFDDVIIPNAAGVTTLELIVDGKSEKAITVTIYEKPSELKFIDLPNKIKVGEEIKLKLNCDDVVITIYNDLGNEFGYLDLDNMTLKGKSAGYVNLKATYIYDDSLFVVRQVEVQRSLEKADFIYVDKSVVADFGDEVILNDYIFNFGFNLFNTIEEAMENGSIIFVGSTDEDSISISSKVTLDGRMQEEPLSLRITINSDVHNVIIRNFSLTDDSKIILLNGNENIFIENNEFTNTSPATSSWVETNKYTNGIIQLANSGKYHNNISITWNVFNEIGDCGININNTHNITIENNSFTTFARDAIRFNNGIIKEECTWRVVNNTFLDGDYSGIYFRTYGSDTADIYHFIDVIDNIFYSVGKKNEEFTAAVCFRNYQEGGTCVDISHNIFYGCSKYIFLRNNAVPAHQSNFVGYVTGNLFKSVPSKYYFNNLNSSGDTFATHPKQTKLLNNAYLDDNKEITPDSSLFIGNYNSTTISSSKVEKLYRFNLHHVLFVGKEANLIDVISDYDDTKFIVTSSTIEAKEAGTYTIKHNNETFEIVCIKNIEMVVRFINTALGELGYQEMDANGNTGTSGNYTKYGEWYGINPGAWCAMYVSWCANQAGVPTTIVPKYAAVQSGMEWYMNKGLFKYKEDYTPKAGDIMFMKSNGASHTGIVLYCDGKTLYTVEGNTSDCCALRKYDVTNGKITGYGTPEWPYYNPSGYNFSSGNPQDGSGHSTR